MKLIDQLKNDLALAKRKREEYLPNWQRNVNERRGKDFDTAVDEGRSMVPVDWTLTKTKSAQLYSQMPQVRLTPKHPSYAEAVPVFAKIVNDLMVQANVDAVMNEVVVDCVNAAGIGACLVRYESLSVEVPVAKADPIAEKLLAAVGQGQASPEAPEADEPAAMVPEMEAPADEAAEEAEEPTDSPAEEATEGEAPDMAATLPSMTVTDRRFVVDRISPSDLLWPTSFRLSDWNKAPWLGHSARAPWAKAKRLLRLKDEDKDKVIDAAVKSHATGTVANPADRENAESGEMVEYDEIFYWRYLYHEDEKYYDAIQHVVFVAGLDEPVINEPWKGQEFDAETGRYIGACLLPIRILTLAYISDEAIPPSDSAIIRPQVKELQESRQHMKEQRKHSRPLRWFDVDRVDPSMTADLIAGTWNGMIPTIGAGDKVLGEVARSAIPRENMEMDRILKQDIQEAVSVGPNQSGMYASGERSAQEAAIVQQSFQTEIGQQRAKVAALCVGVAQVLAGLWVLFGVIEPTGIGASIGPDGVKRLSTWDFKRINQKFVFDVRSDSTVRVDAQQLVEQLKSVLNVTAQSGFINPKPLITRIIELNGIDPMEVVVDPQAKGPEPPKITYSFKAEDLANPMVVALVLDAGMTPEKLEAAKIVLSQLMEPPKVDQGGAPGAPPAAMPPAGGPPPPVTDPQVPEKAFENWEAAPRINTRRAEG